MGLCLVFHLKKVVMLVKTKAIQILQTLVAKEVEVFSDHLDLFAAKPTSVLKEIMTWWAPISPSI